MILEHKGISVYFSQEGRGEVVVLLHGFLENSGMWKDLIPELSNSNTIVAIDLLGHGRTSCIGYIHTMEMMADMVNAVLIHLKINEAKFIGHSMGGYVALAFAELYPEKIQGLCLMNSTAVADSTEKQVNRDRAIAAVKHNHKTFVSMSISNLFAPDNRERFENEIEQVKNEALDMNVQGIVAALEGMKIRKDHTNILQNSSFIKMMIAGHEDPILNFESLTSQLVGTDVMFVELSGGHMSHIENKKELTYNLKHFIEN